MTATSLPSGRLAGLPVDVVTVAHGGVAAARNHGLSLVDTSWVCFLDDDNLLHPAYLASVQEFVSTRDAVQALNTYYWVFATDFLPGVDRRGPQSGGVLVAPPPHRSTI